MADLLELRAFPDRQNVLSMNAETEIRLLLKLWPSEELRSIEPKTDTSIALAFDCSSSMLDGNKLETAIESAKMIVDTIPETQKLTLIAFGSRIHLLVDNALPTADEKENIKSQIEQIRALAGGSTNMKDAIHDAQKALQRSKSSAKVMVVLSDGAADSTNDAELAAKEATKNGIQIFAVGIGADYEADSLLNLAKPSNGTVFGESDVDKIKETFATLISRIETFVATNAKLDVKFSDKVNVGLAFKASPEQAFLGNTILEDGHAIFNVGNIEKDKAYAFLCLVSVPQWDPGVFKVCDVKLTYDVPSKALTGVVQEVPVTVTYTKDRKQSETVNGEVLDYFRRAGATQLAERFVEAHRNGDSALCAKYLRILIRRYEEINDVANVNHYKQILDDLVSKGEISNEALNASVVASTVVSGGGELPSIVDDSF